MKFDDLITPNLFDKMDYGDGTTEYNQYVFINDDGKYYTSFGIGYMTHLKEEMESRKDEVIKGFEMTYPGLKYMGFEKKYNSSDNKWYPTHQTEIDMITKFVTGLPFWFFKYEPISAADEKAFVIKEPTAA